MMRRIGPQYAAARWTKFCVLVVMMTAISGGAMRAQEDVPFAGGQMIRGTVTATTSDRLSIKTEKGEAYQIAVTANTRIMKDRQPVKMAEIKTGDGVGAMGVLDASAKTVHAAFVFVVDAEQAKKAREGLGKVYIAGRVKAIDELKLTIQRPDGVVQVIAVDESTSFRKGRPMQAAMSESGQGDEAASSAESITLADIKVGDSVAGKGALKNGVFVPTQLAVMDASARQRRRQSGNGADPVAGPQ